MTKIHDNYTVSPDVDEKRASVLYNLLIFYERMQAAKIVGDYFLEDKENEEQYQLIGKIINTLNQRAAEIAHKLKDDLDIVEEIDKKIFNRKLTFCIKVHLKDYPKAAC